MLLKFIGAMVVTGLIVAGGWSVVSFLRNLSNKSNGDNSNG